MDDNLTVYTRNRAAEGRCRACRAQQPSARDDDDTIAEAMPEHTCRRPPAVPRAVRAARVQAAAEVFTERELAIRRQRLAEINARG
jgi:hypothetical protein